MKWALLALIVGLLLSSLALHTTEYFVDPDQVVKQPCPCTSEACPPACRAWKSKIDAAAPSNAVTADYLAVLRAFFDTVYNPSGTKPTEAQVDTFLASSAGTVAGVDRAAVKRIILDGFNIDESGTAASREEKTQMFKPSYANLAPDMGRDELRTRAEARYSGANPTPSTRFSEGDYAPVQQSTPNKPGQWDDGSMLWKGPRPASVCPCAENIM